jgi:bifunctional UDP-N-acetylglucosamine pyrophosphorylase/glucosamine-1-phosphate N-acetyltransferase
VPSKSTARSLAAVVLAAGKGKRLKSGLPKVLHPVAGRPLLWHAVRNALAAKPQRLVFVLGNGADRVEEAVRSWSLSPEPVFVRQDEPLGTGHAVLAAEKAVGRADEILVIGGDFDPVAPEDVRALLRTHRRTNAAATILTAEVDEPGGYARIVRDGTRLLEIVEGTDAPAELLERREVSALVFAFRRDDLYKALPLVGRENRRREYYLNAVLPILMDKGERISAIKVDTAGMMGPNSRSDLARLGTMLRTRISERHMANGVGIVDPAATYIDADVRIGRDTTIYPNTYLEGETTIGSGARIGPSVRVVDSKIGDRSTVSFAVVLGSVVRRDVSVGPFVRIRPGTVLEDGSKAGAFVDIKNARVGRGSKVPHLSYVGDADIGRDVNIGAANVFANYDGYEKHRTVVDDDARTGSATILVAPVRVGKGAVTGAGSVITKDVPPGALAVERSEQRVVKGYRERKDAEHAARTGKGAGAKARGKGAAADRGARATTEHRGTRAAKGKGSHEGAR